MTPSIRFSNSCRKVAISLFVVKDLTGIPYLRYRQSALRRSTSGTEEVLFPHWHAVKIYEKWSVCLAYGEHDRIIGDVASLSGRHMASGSCYMAGLTQEQLGGATYDITGSWDEDRCQADTAR